MPSMHSSRLPISLEPSPRRGNIQPPPPPNHPRRHAHAGSMFTPRHSDLYIAPRSADRPRACTCHSQRSTDWHAGRRRPVSVAPLRCNHDVSPMERPLPHVRREAAMPSHAVTGRRCSGASGPARPCGRSRMADMHDADLANAPHVTCMHASTVQRKQGAGLVGRDLCGYGVNRSGQAEENATCYVCVTICVVMLVLQCQCWCHDATGYILGVHTGHRQCRRTLPQAMCKA